MNYILNFFSFFVVLFFSFLLTYEFSLLRVKYFKAYDGSVEKKTGMDLSSTTMCINDKMHESQLILKRLNKDGILTR